MRTSRTRPNLARRVTAYYLLFALGAVIWLTVGVALVSQSLLSSHSESLCLVDVGKAASAVGGRRQGGPAEIQGLIDQLSATHSLAYCAVADKDGRFLAHSDRTKVGTAVEEHAGARCEWGDVDRVRFVDADSRILREYRTPIRSGGQTWGIFHFAVVEPSLWNAIRSTAEYAPATIAGPVLLVALGVLVLRRLVRSAARVDGQLQELAAAPAVAEVALAEVPVHGAASSGWNRLAEHWNLIRQRTGLESRLAATLEGFRQRKADQILNSLPEGVALTDDQGRVTFANQALSGMLGAGMDPQVLCGKSMAEHLELEGNGSAHSPFLNPDARSRPVVAEMSRSADDVERMLRVARYPLRAAKGASGTGHVWAVRDITQQKLAEQMRNQFVTSATHELRTPLANIKAYAETIALNEVLDVERQKEFCNIINAEATRLSRFVDDLLSISSMEIGSLSLVRQETDLERLLREVVDKVRPQMAQKRLSFRHSFPEKLPKLKLDKDKITATLVNLLGNAAKYTEDEGQVLFQVRAKQDSVEIDVEDSGIGIAAAELPKVFDKFFRSTDPRVRAQPGNGLGLSLAYEVVRLHGGKLEVQSEVNKGTRFRVTLPLG